MAITTQLSKATPKWVLYIGLILLVLGIYIFSKKNPNVLVGGMLVFVGFVMSTFWLANRKDEMCAYNDETDQEVCTPIKK